MVNDRERIVTVTPRKRYARVSDWSLMVMSRAVKPMLCPVLAGRDAELQTLTAALERAENGSGGVVVLTGDAGVGKSRLTREITTLAAGRGFLTLTGRAVETTVPVPFRPVAEALIRAARRGLASPSAATTLVSVPPGSASGCPVITYAG